MRLKHLLWSSLSAVIAVTETNTTCKHLLSPQHFTRKRSLVCGPFGFLSLSLLLLFSSFIPSFMSCIYSCCYTFVIVFFIYPLRYFTFSLFSSLVFCLFSFSSVTFTVIHIVNFSAFISFCPVPHFPSLTPFANQLFFLSFFQILTLSLHCFLL